MEKILGLDLESGKLSNEEAKKLFFHTLAFPLQSVCRYLVSFLKTTMEIFSSAYLALENKIFSVKFNFNSL